MKRIKDASDATLWLGYWGRFLPGGFAKSLRQIELVVWELEIERDEARERAARLAVALEKAEAAACGGKEKP